MKRWTFYSATALAFLLTTVIMNNPNGTNSLNKFALVFMVNVNYVDPCGFTELSPTVSCIGLPWSTVNKQKNRTSEKITVRLF